MTKFIEDEGIEPDIEILRKMKNYDLAKLIAIYSDTKDKKEKDIAKLLIIKELGIVDLERQGYILDEVLGELNRVLKKLEEHIDIFKSHRHERSKIYTEKPSW